VPTLALPKYGSKRNLVLPPFLAGLLAELLESHDSEWVFPAMDGGPLLQTDFSTYYWDPVLNGAPERTGRYARPKIPAVEGIEEMPPHGLRHGQKVWNDEDGHPRVVVEERMGHILQGVEGVYSHVTPAMEMRVAQTLQARWERSVEAVYGSATALAASGF
jgi:integrase